MDAAFDSKLRVIVIPIDGTDNNCFNTTYTYMITFSSGKKYKVAIVKYLIHGN